MDIPLELEVKQLVGFAVRNSKLESLHGGRICPTCGSLSGFTPQYSRISNSEMKELMKDIVNRLYTILKLKEENPAHYEFILNLWGRSTKSWDEPEFLPFREL